MTTTVSYLVLSALGDSSAAVNLILGDLVHHKNSDNCILYYARHSTNKRTHRIMSEVFLDYSMNISKS